MHTATNEITRGLTAFFDAAFEEEGPATKNESLKKTQECETAVDQIPSIEKFEQACVSGDTCTRAKHHP